LYLSTENFFESAFKHNKENQLMPKVVFLLNETAELITNDKRMLLRGRYTNLSLFNKIFGGRDAVNFKYCSQELFRLLLDMYFSSIIA